MKSILVLPLLILCAAAFSAQSQTPKPVPATVGAQTQGMGRLFFTPEQRGQLDLLRLKKVVASQTKDESPPEIVTYTGIVKRTDGDTTVWVNNKTLTARELREMPMLAGRIERDGKLRLQATQAGSGSIELKVGQSAELLSGRVAESFNAKPASAVSALKPAEKKTAAAPVQAAGPGAPGATSPDEPDPRSPSAASRTQP